VSQATPPQEPTAPAYEPAAPTPATPADAPSSHVLVPKWLVYVLAALVLVGAGFTVGWAVAPDDGSDGSHAAARVPSTLPFGGRQTSGVYLGVVTQTAANGQGAQIAQLASGSPAGSAGLKTGDVITKVDDQSVDGPAQLAQRIRSHKVGDQVTIAYTRSGSSATVKVKLGDRSTRQD
jgi:membrane-associated protease RseP (regulator of RpoE activity)